MFTELDFDDEPDLITVVQPYVDDGGVYDSFTVDVAKGQDYVGIETEYAVSTALGGADAIPDPIFTVVLPVTESEGASRGRRIIISNESDPNSGDGMVDGHPSIRLLAGKVMSPPPGEGYVGVAKISGMDEWTIPMMTAVTVVCTGGEGPDCKWFIVGHQA